MTKETKAGERTGWVETASTCLNFCDDGRKDGEVCGLCFGLGKMRGVVPIIYSLT